MRGGSPAQAQSHRFRVSEADKSGIFSYTEYDKNYEWETLINDKKSKSFVKYIKNFTSIANLCADEIYNKALDLPLETKHKIPRSTCWITSHGCTCPYKYGRGVKVLAHAMPKWMYVLMGILEAATGLTLELDSCNVNRYDSGRQSCGWHSDNENLFRGDPNGINILSFSLGVTRKFELQHKITERIWGIDIEDGDLVWMGGYTQAFYKHRVPPSTQEGDRINLTFRSIMRHEDLCGRTS